MTYTFVTTDFRVLAFRAAVPLASVTWFIPCFKVS